MSQLPEKAYQIYDPTDTDDLVLWMVLDQPSEYARDQGLRQQLKSKQ